jgi:hypothetical protein
MLLPGHTFDLNCQLRRYADALATTNALSPENACRRVDTALSRYKINGVEVAAAAASAHEIEQMPLR